MLHTAYQSMANSGQDKMNWLNQLLNKQFKYFNNADLNSKMKLYSKIEPGLEDNELHSILGTEYRGIFVELEDYYSNYFNRRISVVAANEHITTLFKGYESRLIWL